MNDTVNTDKEDTIKHLRKNISRLSKIVANGCFIKSETHEGEDWITITPLEVGEKLTTQQLIAHAKALMDNTKALTEELCTTQ